MVTALPPFITCTGSRVTWCRHDESNAGPTDYKSVALPTELWRQNFGGGDKDRTCYILLAKQALSQMSYTPIYYLFYGSTSWARTRDQMINSHLLYQLS